MRRSVWIFLASIFLPSLVLAWMAIRSVQDQQVVLEHQQAIICQNITDSLAKNIQGQMDQTRSDFVKTTRQLLDEASSPLVLAQDFNHRLREAWPLAELGFAVNLNGEIYSPKPSDGPESRTFRDENDRFLSNRENVELYSSNSFFANAAAQNNAPQLTLKTLQQAPVPLEDVQKRAAQKDIDELTTGKMQNLFSEVPRGEMQKAVLSSAANKKSAAAYSMPLNTPGNPPSDSVATTASPPAPSMDDAAVPAPDASAATGSATPAPATAAPPPALPISTTSAGSTGAPGAEAEISPIPTAMARDSATASSLAGSGIITKIQRQVIPQQMLAHDTASLSNTVPEESDFRRVMGTDTSGALARFLENKLELIVWSHPSSDAPIVFGAQLDQTKLVETLKPLIHVPDAAPDTFSRSSGGETCVAILDDIGHPVALSQPGFKGDWKHPFVATEIGEVLPHWEAALYLVDPQQISRAARTLRFTLGLIVLLLVAAIVSGGSLIAADVRRQVRLAQQKTDFVSNVSHELKTPLTSIRMFAELLAEKRVPDEERQTTYLRIIAAEASRLTRLINNVLDFARLERGVRVSPGEYRPCDLVEAARDVVETCGPHLEAAGISFQHEIEAETLPIRGDRDALAQIILNLVSNAEKYGGNDVLVRVRRQETSAGALGCVDVLDRGAGIPAAQVKTIFEPFHRLDDSLASAIPGSGLGLTLARRMARAHGGDVTYSPRAGGGSCFTLSIPLTPLS